MDLLRDGYCSAKELTVLPGRTATIRDAAAYGLILTQGHGRFGSHSVATPSMIRFGQMTEDELFVTKDAALAGVRIENTSATDPLVILKHFGPGNPDAERFARLAGGSASAEVSMADASTKRFPALHNAMWPGLVGKGPDSEPAIDLDTMLDLTANASVDGVTFDGVDLFLFDPHVSIDASDDDLKRLVGSDPRAESARRLAGCAGLAADRRRLGDGRRRRTPSVRDAGQEGLSDWRQASCVGHQEHRRRPHRLRLESSGVGEGSGRQHQEDRRHLPRGVHGR